MRYVAAALVGFSFTMTYPLSFMNFVFFVFIFYGAIKAYDWFEDLKNT